MGSEICKEFGNNVKRLRKAAGYSQESFAEMIDIGTTSLSLIETGKGFVTAKTLSRIADALDVDVSRLFVCIKDKNTEDFYNNILSKFAKFKNNKQKLLLLDAFLNAL